MFTTDVGLPQAQVCYICHRYGRRKNRKTEKMVLNWQIFSSLKSRCKYMKSTSKIVTQHFAA